VTHAALRIDRWTLLLWLATFAWAVIPRPTSAQDHTGHVTTDAAPHDHSGSESTPLGWHWSADARVFVGGNWQDRTFRDFRTFESQNWFMATGQRRGERSTVTLSTMFSLEPWTLHRIGSPQVFQTGETYRGAPLIDYQHPHDLFMGLGTDYRRTTRTGSWYVGADLVGAPTLGPDAFMHRASADALPTAPLSHHYLDSTHITPGVLRTGLQHHAWGVEGSWFHGREPDERRTDIDLGKPDSYAARLSWTHGAWRAQASAARLHLPEVTTPYDADTLTASMSYVRPESRLIAWTAAFGQKREIHGNFEAYLVEAVVRAATRARLSVRAESVDKEILDAGFHPRGVFHRHRHSQVGAVTIGYLHDLVPVAEGMVAVGGDVTVYGVPANLRESYGSPRSYHLYVRYALHLPGTATAHEHK
jgi:hypothetical protein